MNHISPFPLIPAEGLPAANGYVCFMIYSDSLTKDFRIHRVLSVARVPLSTKGVRCAGKDKPGQAQQLSSRTEWPS